MKTGEIYEMIGMLDEIKSFLMEDLDEIREATPEETETKEDEPKEETEERPKAAIGGQAS